MKNFNNFHPNYSYTYESTIETIDFLATLFSGLSSTPALSTHQH